MRALIVYETQFGNTARIAEAIAAGLAESGAVELVGVDDAVVDLPDDLDLLVVGGPTHVLSMSRPETRADARRDGATGSRGGIREWLDSLPHDAAPHARLVTFDTRQGRSFLTGSAARAAARAVRAHGMHAEEAMDFFVTGKEGPLEEGELERATAWGRSLARRAAKG